MVFHTRAQALFLVFLFSFFGLSSFCLAAVDDEFFDCPCSIGKCDHEPLDQTKDMDKKWTMRGLGLSLEKPSDPSHESPTLKRIRAQTINRILKTYNILNRNAKYPLRQVDPGFMPEKNWYSRIGVWLPKVGVDPVKALEDLESRKDLLFDCRTAAILVGMDIFNTLIPNDTPCCPYVSKDYLQEKSCERLSIARVQHDFIVGGFFFERSRDGVGLPGSHIYISGHPRYTHGFNMGHHLFFVGYKKDKKKWLKQYIGFHSELFRGGPLTAQKIQKNLAEAYMREFKPKENLDTVFQIVRSKKPKNFDFLPQNVIALHSQKLIQINKVF